VTVIELWERPATGELYLRREGSPTALSVLLVEGHDFERHAEAMVEAAAGGSDWPRGAGLPLLQTHFADLEPSGCRCVATYSNERAIPALKGPWSAVVITAGLSPGSLRPSSREYLLLSSVGLARALFVEGPARPDRVMVAGVWCDLDEGASVRYGEVMGVSAVAQKRLSLVWLVCRVPDADWIGAWFNGSLWQAADREHVKEAVQRPRLAPRRSRREAEDLFRARWAAGEYAGTPEDQRGTCEQVFVEGWQFARGFSL
jgi:hypothetical protein